MSKQFDHTAAVDICVPVYNSAAVLRETIESILDQDFTDFKLLLSIDKCEDDSAAICHDFAGDWRVTVFEHKQPLGYVGNSNFLVRSATAPYMMFAPHDDILAPNLVSLLYDFSQRQTDCSIAIPSLVGFGTNPSNFHQHEVRGPVHRRLLDIIMNQRSAAAFHGLVRIKPQTDFRPMLAGGYLRDFEADVDWMARAALDGELRRVDRAVVHKRFSPGMTSQIWGPRTSREARQLLVQHTRRLAELAFTVCENDQQRRQVILAALVRLYGLGLNWGVQNSGNRRPLFRTMATRALFSTLSGQTGKFARSLPRSGLLKEIKADNGVVGASLLARKLENAIAAGHLDLAKMIYHKALEMDPLAGWADPFRQKLETLA